MERIWLKGDTHLHTIHSVDDGHFTKGQLVEKCKNVGLDFMIITDHNANAVKESYFDEDMLIIQGEEVTGELGHVNVWGEKVPVAPPYALNNAGDYAYILEECRKAGATISVNHPFCSNCGFHLDLEDYNFDCVEVWNTIQHSDNMKNRDWWVGQLLKGNQIGAVGGSDFHKDYPIVNLLASPTTIVHTKSKTPQDILSALREGRSVVTNSPNSSMIYLTCDEAQIGDTVEFKENLKAQIKITNLKKGHTVKIFNNEKLIFENKANKSAEVFLTTVDIEEKGFVRAEITYRFSPLMKKIYKTVEKSFLGALNEDLPEFIWAFTNPIYIK